MNRIAHTPGPWEHDGQNVFVDTRQQVCCGRGRDECCGDPDIEGALDQIASVTRGEDANLIAAAPDLLNVVRGFRRKLETYVNVYPGDKELRRILTECDAAITKANGESA